MSSNGALQQIRARASHARPRIAVLLGSGWGGLTQQLVDASASATPSWKAFPPAGVAGPCRRAVAGPRRPDRSGGAQRPPPCLRGRRRRRHEDALRTLRELGCQVLVQTNAAGSLDPVAAPGSLMLISDHLNLAQRSPLVGESDSERFVDMVGAYDATLRRTAYEVAVRRGITLYEGVFAWVLGPQFETPAEIRMLQLLGAHAVGMSTVPETIIARHLGLRVLAISLITNMAAGLSDERLSHAHTLAQAAAAQTGRRPVGGHRAGDRA